MLPYHKALRHRGSLTAWLDDSATAAWTDRAQPKGLRRRRMENQTSWGRQTQGMRKLHLVADSARDEII
ncbi:hypothetical protein nublan001_45740 [Klebsiella pneumoniae]|nr:hypothetical protein NUBL1858_36380 [Klebsiella pneumoniae]